MSNVLSEPVEKVKGELADNEAKSGNHDNCDPDLFEIGAFKESHKLN